MGIVLKFKKDTERHKSASVTLDDKSVWKMKEPGDFQSKCSKMVGSGEFLFKCTRSNMHRYGWVFCDFNKL